MGSCFSIQLSGDDQTLIRIFRFLCGEGYIRNLKDNLRDLQREMEDLKAIQDEVQNKVAIEERQLRQVCEPVKVWLKRVEKTDTEFNDLLCSSPIQLENLCLCDLLSKNVCSSYGYGKSVFLLLEEVKKLKLEGKFDVVTAELTPISKVGKRSTQPTIGQEKMLEKAWNRLMEDGVGIMGLHGMGGVGKTTLFKKIHDKFVEMAGRFDEVIWVVVSQGASISKLQEDIAKRLNLCGDNWMNKNEIDKAEEMQRVLQEKRFFLLLDDIWEKVNLDAIGVPFPSKKNGCKVAFTTRSRDVCGQMGDNEPMEVKCLEWNEAWELFKEKVGEITLRGDPGIVELAKKVAEKCHGLPLALNVIGETMASQHMVQEWEDAVDELTRSAAEFSDTGNKILSILKYSYDNLRDEHIKSCFLYCALFPEDCSIGKENLTHYWICEGFIPENKVLKSAKNKGYVILGTLIRANLLTERGTGDVVMHDVVREMALWIASGLGKRKETVVVQANVGLREIPEVKDWGAVKRMSLIKNKIEEITCGSNCSELTTLFLQNNNLKNFSGEFVQSMQKLVVLDLSDNEEFNKLPEHISKLASLQYLGLSYTGIEELPVGLQELKKLTHLDLTGTDRLCSISGISKLSSLRVLKLEYSNVHGDVSLVKELQLLKHLQFLSMKISTELGLEYISDDRRLAKCINSLDISRFQQKPFNISLLVSMENLRDIWVESCHILEINTIPKCRKSDFSYLHSPTSNPCFTNLSCVGINHCNGMKDLTWILFAPNLTNVSISDSGEVEEILSKEKASNLTGIKPFEKLTQLTLSNLPKLESIYWRPLPFPLLWHIRAYKCPKLKKLPFDATSVPRLDRVFRGFTIDMTPREQKNDIVWEDEDTRNRFMPIFY